MGGVLHSVDKSIIIVSRSMSVSDIFLFISKKAGIRKESTSLGKRSGDELVVW
jgi:hypothetical protein